MTQTTQPFNATQKNHCVPASILWVNRAALFIIYFWFGFLKLISKSPAENLVTHLHQATIVHYISIHHFLTGLGLIECTIGILWMIPKLTKVALIFFLMQMAAAFLPLVMIPQETWSDVLVLTLSGQYIFKNVVLVACAFTIYKDCQVKSIFMSLF